MIPGDLEIIVYSAGVNTPRRVVVIHRPTGERAEATDLSYIQAQERALTELRRKLEPTAQQEGE